MSDPAADNGRKFVSRCLFAILILIAAGALQLTAMVVAPDPHGPYGVTTMVERNAPPPYSYRALMPLAVGGLEKNVTGVAVKVRSIWSVDWSQEQSITNNRVKSFLRHIGATSEDDAVHLVFWGFTGTGCFFAFGLAMWRHWARTMGESQGALFSVVGMLCVLPVLLRPPLQMYDPMTLAMGGALAFFALRQSWAPFFVILPFACAAKEALLILAILPMISQYRAKAWTRFGVSAGLAVAAYFIGKGIAGTPSATGPQFQIMLQENIDLLRGRNLGALILSLAALAPVFALVATAWKSMPREDRIRLGVTAAVMAPPLVVFGRLVEARIFYDILPLALMVAIPNSWLVASDSSPWADTGESTDPSL